MEEVESLVRMKIELLQQQKAKTDRLYQLFNGPDGFNEHSHKTLKNLEVAIAASKRPGYFSYYEAPPHVKAMITSGEVGRLHEQALQLQKQIDQLTSKIENAQQTGNDSTSLKSSGEVGSPKVHNLKQWFSEYGQPKTGTTSDMYSSFSPEKKVYGGTSHYSAFRSQSTTMKKGRLTK